MKQKSYIDSHKGITFFFIIFLIYFYNSWSDIIALTYLSLNGTYGVLWVLKSKIFPDKTKLPINIDGHGFIGNGSSERPKAVIKNGKRGAGFSVTDLDEDICLEKLFEIS